ncbi:MAG: hypothetical protein CMH54_04480 [Myxococcales bacterium]|nr:hypothetical protein [Myxococcales bacterium]
MGMSSPNSGSNGRLGPPALAEINVTPFVDVMLVLLVIFMATASVAKQKDLAKLQQQQDMLELQEQEFSDPGDKQNQLVELDLPQTNSKAVNLKESRKIVLSFTADYTFVIEGFKDDGSDDYKLSCKEKVAGWPKTLPAGQDGDLLFRKCLKPFAKKLLVNPKLKSDKELYLRADRALDYGHVVILMAAIREAGIHKFGLVAENE